MTQRKRLAKVLVEWAGGSVDQRERELRDLIWTAAQDKSFRREIERAMKRSAREMHDEMESER